MQFLKIMLLKRYFMLLHLTDI